MFELAVPAFGLPLRNALSTVSAPYVAVRRAVIARRKGETRMSDLHRNFIAGEWVGSADAGENRNPSNTDDVVGLYARGTKADAEKAIDAAHAAAPAWARSGVQQRHDALRKVADEILARREELGRLLSREEGKPLADGIGEVTRAGQIFAFFAGEAVRLTGEKVPSVRPGIDVEMTREPVGVVGIIAPWNFPIAIPAWKIAPALCYGNAVVFKPADLVPGSAWALSDIISRAGFPAGVFNLDHGPRIGGRPGVSGGSQGQRHHLHRLGYHGTQCRSGRGGAHGQVPARDGRQEPSGGARRRRSRRCGRVRRQRRLLPDRPALHRLVAA